jgi:hypothetical protein
LRSEKASPDGKLAHNVIGDEPLEKIAYVLSGKAEDRAVS